MSVGLPTFDHGFTLNGIGECGSRPQTDIREFSYVCLYHRMHKSEILSRRSTKMR